MYCFFSFQSFPVFYPFILLHAVVSIQIIYNISFFIRGELSPPAHPFDRCCPVSVVGRDPVIGWRMKVQRLFSPSVAVTAFPDCLRRGWNGLILSISLPWQEGGISFLL